MNVKLELSKEHAEELMLFLAKHDSHLYRPLLCQCRKSMPGRSAVGELTEGELFQIGIEEQVNASRTKP